MSEDLSPTTQSAVDSTLDPNIELQVRRVLEEGELKIRSEISSELEKHRNFLSQQVGNFVKLVGIVLAGGVGFFGFFFGNSLDRVSNQIEREVDSKVVEYAIAEDYQERLETRLSLIINSDRVKDEVETAVRNSLTTDINDLVAESLNKEITDLSDDKVEEILVRAYGAQIRLLEKEAKQIREDVALLHTVLDKNLDDEISQALLDRVQVNSISPIRLGR